MASAMWLWDSIVSEDWVHVSGLVYTVIPSRACVFGELENLHKLTGARGLGLRCSREHSY